MLQKPIVIVALCCMTAIFAQEAVKTQPQPVNVVNNPSPASIQQEPTTTIKPPKTTSPSNITTTVAPNTTTPSTTTKTSTSTTPTTPTTTTKPTPPPTTTNPPTPSPPVNPTQGNWSIIDPITNKICIMLDMSIQFDIMINYNNKTTKLRINVPSNATASGNCGNQTQLITLQWSPIINVTDFITFNFTKTNTSAFQLAEILAKLNVSLPGKDTQIFKLSHKKYEFQTPITKSYKCNKEQKLNLTVDSAAIDIYPVLKINHVQMEAFHNSTSNSFSSAMDCMSNETPDVVPIAVGCALAALVIIVLIVYLMGRRRSQARGYLSMFTENKREEDYIPMKNLSCFQ